MPDAILARIRAWVREYPWAMLPAAYEVMVDVLARRAAGARLTAEEIAARTADGPGRGELQVRDGVAILPVYGVLAPRLNLVEEISGGTSTGALTGQLRQALAEPSIHAIVLDVDSPGGSVFGIDELATEIHGARGQKPIVAVARHQAASAAYWLASQADEVVVSPSGMVGSIGVFVEHWDESAMDAELGLKVTLVSAGKYKTEANPYEPLNDEARAALQATVDGYYALFTRAVARGRGVPVDAVRSGFGEGRMVMAQAALKAQMVDRVETLDATIRRMARPAGGGRGGSKAADEAFTWRARAALAQLRA
ncbi:MAG: S49 family peptidase [Acidobacteria bacterium]|nr:S49 family peptidase [Acidobacteriota bacterium]